MNGRIRCLELNVGGGFGEGKDDALTIYATRLVGSRYSHCGICKKERLPFVGGDVFNVPITIPHLDRLTKMGMDLLYWETQIADADIIAWTEISPNLRDADWISG